MGKITSVYYQEIDPKIVDIQTAGEFYYNHNLLDVHEMFHDDYERSEIEQLNLRNILLGEAIKCEDIQGNVKVDSSILAISSLKNKVVLVAELR